MKTFKLLPHGWQTAGWIVTGMGAGLMLWGAFMDDGTHDFIFSSPNHKELLICNPNSP